MKSALEIQNSLLWLIIGLYALRCVVFWYKASPLYDWIRIGCYAEEFVPTMLVVFFYVAAFFGTLAGIYHYYRWISTP